jgi:hypothetical protein
MSQSPLFRLAVAITNYHAREVLGMDKQGNRIMIEKRLMPSQEPSSPFDADLTTEQVETAGKDQQQPKPTA